MLPILVNRMKKIAIRWKSNKSRYRKNKTTSMSWIVLEKKSISKNIRPNNWVNLKIILNLFINQPIFSKNFSKLGKIISIFRNKNWNFLKKLRLILKRRQKMQALSQCGLKATTRRPSSKKSTDIYATLIIRIKKYQRSS